MTHYRSFAEFVEQFVIPLHQEHPDWTRLDGWKRGSNRARVASFEHGERRWQVHGDTRFEPTMIAYRSIKSGRLADPFVTKPTVTGEALELAREIRAEYQSPHKHFFAYTQEPAKSPSSTDPEHSPSGSRHDP